MIVGVLREESSPTVDDHLLHPSGGLDPMTATAENIRELHALHQRAKGLRDRMDSGPKTLANRRSVLAKRQAALEEARKALKEGRAQVKTKETQLQALQSKQGDLSTKRNQARKQDEYNALTAQMHHDQKTIERLELEVLEGMELNDTRAAELATLEVETKKLADDVEALARELDAKRAEQQAQFEALNAAIVEAETIIPADQRERYRRNVKQRGADAMAAAEDGACTGCFVSMPPQMLNELINGGQLVFCKSCGRILYLAEQDQSNTRRYSR